MMTIDDLNLPVRRKETHQHIYLKKFTVLLPRPLLESNNKL